MNQKKDFLYYIIDQQGRSLYVDNNGNVARTPVPRWLNSTPDGWQEVSVAFGRSRENPGIYRSYTVPIKAVQDGGKIIKHISATEGIQAKYYLVIQKLNRATDKHEDFFVSKLDFKTNLNDQDGATITILEGGLVQLVKNRGNTSYELPLNVPEALTIYHDGIILKGDIQFIAFNGDSLDLLRNHTTALNMVQNDGGLAFGARATQRVVTDTLGPAVNATGQNFLQPNIEGPVTIKVTDLQIKVSWTGGAGVNPTPGIGFSVTARVQEGDTIISSNVLYSAIGVNNVYGPNITLGRTHVVNGTFTFNVPQNAKVYLLCFVTVVGATGDALTRFDYQAEAENLIEIDFDSRFAPTRIKALRPEYVWNELIKKVSDGKFTGESIPLRTTYKNTVLTSGDGIRGLEDAVIKTTLNDFIKSYFGQHALSPNITDTLATMEEYSFFFGTNDVIDLTAFGDVANLQWGWEESYIPSEVHVGIADQTYDELNGKDETHSTFKFKTIIDEQENVYDFVKPYRTDPIGAEVLRLNLTQKKTTDSSSDNDTFMFDVADVSITGGVSFSNIVNNTITTIGRFQSVFPGSVITVAGSTLNNGVYNVVSVLQSTNSTEITVQEAVNNEAGVGIIITSNEAALNRPVFDSITGVISPESIYNVLLSPKRSLLAHGPYIRSGLNLQDSTMVEFLSADKNDKLSTTQGGVTITEKANVLVSSLGSPLFRPIVFTFETQVPITFMTILSLPPHQRYGKVKFSWKGNTYKGFIVDAKQVPQLNPKQVWKLLCAPETNILPLING